MNIKSHQKAPLQQDFRIGIILTALLALMFGLFLVQVRISAALTILSFVAFLVFVSPYTLMGNLTLIKVLRSDFEANPNRFVPILAGLWGLAQLYALLSGQFDFYNAALSIAWLAPLVVLVRQLPNRPIPDLLDWVIVLILWLPIEFGLFSGIGIPPARAQIGPLMLIGLVFLIYTFLVVRKFEVGFTYRLKGEDVRLVVLNFLLFFFIAIIIGSLTGFITLARHIPPVSEMLIRAFAIFFFIALPEELLFRGVMYKLLLKQFQGNPKAVGKALVLSSVIFGLAHGNNANPPFFDLTLGTFVWQVPWAYILLATIAGLFYGWVFIRTKKITAAALLHFLVDWVWFAFLSR